jgi:hypothetical protein
MLKHNESYKVTQESWSKFCPVPRKKEIPAEEPAEDGAELKEVVTESPPENEYDNVDEPS